MLDSELFELANTALGAASNALLMYLITTFSRKELGTYKHLIFAFASFDIFLCFLHAVVKPKIVIVGHVFGAVSHSFIESRALTSCFTSCFTVPFSLMNIHFLYRFIAVRYPEKIQRFSEKRVIALLVFYPTAQVIIWFFLGILFTPTDDAESLEIVRNAIKEEYNITVLEGYLILHHWKNGELNRDPTIIVVVIFVIVIINFTTATSLGSLTYYYIGTRKEISYGYKAFQRSILIAVLAQTLVPVIFVYIPYACVAFFPFFDDLPLFSMPFLFPVLLSIFPEWDAIIIILLIRDYRDGVGRMLGCQKIQKIENTAFTVTQGQMSASAM